MAWFRVRVGVEEPIEANSAAELDRLTGMSGLGLLLVELSDRTKEENSRCPACGFSVHELVATGLLGCPACYEVFRAEIARQVGSPDLVS